MDGVYISTTISNLCKRNKKNFPTQHEEVIDYADLVHCVVAFNGK